MVTAVTTVTVNQKHGMATAVTNDFLGSFSLSESRSYGQRVTLRYSRATNTDYTFSFVVPL